MKRKTIYFTAPRQVELREEALPGPGDDEVVVETTCSAISAGTEMLIYGGHFPHLKDSHDNLSSDLNYPLAYGYACAGIIKETGRSVNKELQGKLVFGFQPHTTHFIAKPSTLLFAPTSSAGMRSLSAEACCFLPNIETAVNLIQDAAPIFGERVMVLGQGVVGLLVASLLREFPLESLVTSDRFELRRNASLELGVNDAFDPQIISTLKETVPLDKNQRYAYAQNFDLIFEVSGSPSALNDAIILTAFNGRIVIGSWYGDKHAPIELGGAFHRLRIRIISSQVSTISPELSGRWDKARRFEVAWEALKRIRPEKWITHRFPIEEASQAYKLLDENPQATIQVLINYR